MPVLFFAAFFFVFELGVHMRQTYKWTGGGRPILRNAAVGFGDWSGVKNEHLYSARFTLPIRSGTPGGQPWSASA